MAAIRSALGIRMTPEAVKSHTTDRVERQSERLREISDRVRLARIDAQVPRRRHDDA